MSNKNTLAVFDLDGTITNCDTYISFLLFILFKKPQRFINASWLPFAVLIHKMGLRNNSWLKEKFLTSIVSGFTNTEIDQWTHDFSNNILNKHTFVAAKDKINEHLNHGHQLILASASFDFYVEKIGKQLGFHHIVCTKSSWNKNNRLLGIIDGENCYGQNKVRSLQKLITANNIRFDSSICYTDHHSDIALLNWATKGIAINPTSKLSHLISNTNIEEILWR